MRRRSFLIFMAAASAGPVCTRAQEVVTPVAGTLHYPMKSVLIWLRQTGHSYVLTLDLARSLQIEGVEPLVKRNIQMSDDDRTHMAAVEYDGSRLFLAYQAIDAGLVFWITNDTGTLEQTFERDIQSRVITFVSNAKYSLEFETEKKYWLAQTPA